MENQVSIVINGVRYDNSEFDSPLTCVGCELMNWCDGLQEKYEDDPSFIDVCRQLIGDRVFKKSDKKFEV